MPENGLYRIPLDNFLACFRDLSKDGAFVHTSWRRIRDFSWNLLKIIISLQCQKKQTT